MQVPFYDLSRQHDRVQADLEQAFQSVLRGNSFILGQEVAVFEQTFAKAMGVSNAVATSSGLDALKMGLLAMGVGSGHRVVVPAHTFIATWLAVSTVGAEPVPVDVEAETGNLSLDALEKLNGQTVDALIPVHLYGRPAPMKALMSWAQANEVPVLEDAAQAHGAVYRGRPVGSFGRAAAFSFYPAKNLGALGDAGLLLSQDKGLIEQVQSMRNYGGVEKYEHEQQGFNARMDGLQAAFLHAKLPYLSKWNKERQQLASMYLEELDGLPALKLPAKPQQGDEVVWHLFVVRTKERDALRHFLNEKGIGTGLHYPKPPHLQAAYRDLGYGPGSFPVAEAWAAEGLSLPLFPGMQEAEQAYVIEQVKAFFK